MNDTRNNNNNKKYQKFLNSIEKIGNFLPEPMMIFIILIIVLIFSSTLLNFIGVTVESPQDGEILEVKSLLSAEGIGYMVTSLVDNFISYQPLGIVVTMMIAIGIADKSGLLEALIKTIMLSVPTWLIPYVIFFTGNFATVAADAAFLIVPPLAGIIYYTIGRNPLAGVITGFVGASSGYATGVLITTNEPLLAGITNEAVAIVSDGPMVTAIDNYFFMVTGVLLMTLLGGTITRKITEPRLGKYEGDAVQEIEPVTVEQKRALKHTVIAGLIYIALLLVVLFIPNSPLLNEDGGFIPSPFLDGIITFLLGFFATVGLTYGISIKKIKSSKDVMEFASSSVGQIASLIIIFFFVAQFTSFFGWTNMGLWIAVNGAEVLSTINLPPPILIVGIIIFTAFMNLIITSGSGLWAFLAPVFIPMLMQLEYHPAFIQMAYRIGDSATNMITPLSPSLIIALSFMKEWDKSVGLGTIISYTLPYAISILILLILLLVGFMVLGIPIGPGITPFLNE